MVGIGGFFGALGRFLLSGWIGAHAGRFPFGTLAVNVIGSLTIGLVAAPLTGRVLAGGAVRLLVMVGFLGAFTTFSAFSYESLQFWQAGRWPALLANVSLNVGGCLLATAAGVAVASVLTTSRA